MNKCTKSDSAAPALVEALSHDGRGIAVIENKKTFIAGALPNETVTYTIHRKQTNYNEASVSQILNEAKERAKPPCQHYGLCGGCSLQHMNMAMQLALKQQTLLEQLKHFGKVRPQNVLPPLHVKEVGYRRKARLGVKFVHKKNKVLVGFRECAKRFLADLSECQVLHESVGMKLEMLSQLVASLDSFKEIPQIEVAIGDNEVALVFRHMVPLSSGDQQKLIHFGEEHQFHIYLQPNRPEVITKIYPEQDEFIHYTLPDYDLTFAFHPLDFTQVNLEMNRLMIQQALNYLQIKTEEKVLDLFCGIGNFTLPLSRYAKEVVGIEGSIAAIERAKMNAERNKIVNASFYAANLMESLAKAEWIKPYDKILLDPPRAGAKEVLAYFKIFSPEKIVYISCNPATLARDAGELVHTYGYDLTEVGIMNMFPHTSHVEAMAVFQKK